LVNYAKPNQEFDIVHYNREFVITMIVITVIVITEFDCFRKPNYSFNCFLLSLLVWSSIEDVTAKREEGGVKDFMTVAQ
jgi:hypothetical protein